tara:strand:+ start:6156 stop:7196 length:1041 start_codon:yes stop_codon:yes gene_type:complete
MVSTLLNILLSSWELVVAAAPYLLGGFAIAGVMKALLPDDIVVKVLGRQDVSSVAKAALIGAPLPLCSCGVVPVVQSIHKQGASRGASISFLVSTPETGADSVAMTYAMMGWPLAVIRPVAAVFTAFVAGLVENFLGVNQDLEESKSCCPSQNTDSAGINSSKSVSVSFFKRLRDGMKYAYVDLMRDISRNLLIGFLLGGLITHFVTISFLENYFSGSLAGMLGMIIFATPLYICAAASTPVAAAFMMKGMSAGTALVFLMAGPATNIASLSVLAKIFGKRSVLLYIIVILICSLGFGLFFDWVVTSYELPITGITAEHHQESGLLSEICGAILLVCLSYHILKPT